MQFKVVNGAFKVYMNETGTDWSKFPTSELLLRKGITVVWNDANILQTRRCTLTGLPRRLGA